MITESMYDVFIQRGRAINPIFLMFFGQDLKNVFPWEQYIVKEILGEKTDFFAECNLIVS